MLNEFLQFYIVKFFPVQFFLVQSNIIFIRMNVLTTEIVISFNFQIFTSCLLLAHLRMYDHSTHTLYLNPEVTLNDKIHLLLSFPDLNFNWASKYLTGSCRFQQMILHNSLFVRCFQFVNTLILKYTMQRYIKYACLMFCLGISVRLGT